MKKYFYLAAVSAMMLTACSSDNDVVQPTPEPTTPQVTVQQQAVAFDTYLAGATASTRAGDPTGVMTTEKLKLADKGFGVFAYFHDDGTYTTGLNPNFMYNEHISWANGWTYSPLKYWPNETAKDAGATSANYNADSQSTPATALELDKLSFFAYAPYVSTGTGNTLSTSGVSDLITNSWHATEASGIMAIQNEATTGDPLVEWKYTANPDNNVDLLWGVAPAGFSYTNVNGSTTSVDVGMPLKDLVKPDKDQKVKFLFQHALSRIGLSVVSAIDQIAAGDDAGAFTGDPTTKVLIKNVQVWGEFGKQGVLNLNNDKKNEAKWTVALANKSTLNDANPLFWFDNGTAISATTSPLNVANSYIAPNLRYVQSQIDAVTGTSGTSSVTADPYQFVNINTGVLPSEQPLLAGGLDLTKKVSGPAFAYGKVYLNASGAVVTTEASEACDAYVKVGNNYEQVFATSTGTPKATLNGYSKQYYKLTGTAITLGSAPSPLAAGTYYKRTGDAGKYIYEKVVVTSENPVTPASSDIYFTTVASDANELVITELSGANYTGDVYEAQPRYFMVIPTGNTQIKVKITYAVVTKDEKLTVNLSNVENDITKTVTVKLENGKSYNLKLILGLTSVKLDATVADWLVADDSEIWLPQNVE